MPRGVNEIHVFLRVASTLTAAVAFCHATFLYATRRNRWQEFTGGFCMFILSSRSGFIGERSSAADERVARICRSATVNFLRFITRLIIETQEHLRLGNFSHYLCALNSISKVTLTHRTEFYSRPITECRILDNGPALTDGIVAGWIE